MQERTKSAKWIALKTNRVSQSIPRRERNTEDNDPSAKSGFSPYEATENNPRELQRAHAVENGRALFGEDVEDIADDFTVLVRNGRPPNAEETTPDRKGEVGYQKTPDQEVDDKEDDWVEALRAAEDVGRDAYVEKKSEDELRSVSKVHQQLYWWRDSDRNHSRLQLAYHPASLHGLDRRRGRSSHSTA